MANGNGNGVFFKWAAGGMAVALAGVVAFAANGAVDTVKANTDTVVNYVKRVDTLEQRLNQSEVGQAKMTLQIAEIAKALQVPVILDTLSARRDSS